jgi:hypothetical protein
MVPFGVFRLKFSLGIADSGRGPIAAIGAASRSRVCWPDRKAAAPSGGARVRVPPPALRSVPSKVAVFAIFVAQILRNKQSAPGDKSTASSDINLFKLISGYISK